MAGLNKVILIGRIGKDPETYSFEDGTKKISFSLATTESYKDRNTGSWVDQTEWHNIVGYRFLAEKNFAKGDLVYVEGKIKTRKYNDKDGNEKYISEILSEKINILTRSQSNQEYQGASNYNKDDATPAPQDTSNGENKEENMEDDLPF
ncbi:MAG: single-stranded DNA-binding protein [Bacteroidetes bacterium]|nr:single-stranded DNA-binding protein [Bacteroidota bacterium]